MNEEEKKSIETLKEVASDDFDTLGDDISPKMAQNILNFIKKLQKEINRLNDENELLKIITRQYNSYCVNTDDGEPRIILAHKYYFDSGVFVSNFISKDKIRDILNYLNDTELNNYEIVMTFKKMMKELLEDGDYIPRID